MATTLGIIVLVFGRTSMFGQLKDALNTIWDVEPKPGHGIRQIVWDYLLSFSMVACIAFLLMASLLVFTIFSGAAFIAHQPTDFRSGVGVRLARLDGGIAAHDVAVRNDLQVPARREDRLASGLGRRVHYRGAVYDGQGPVGILFRADGNCFGVRRLAGSLVTVLIWVYYSSQILLFGADLTQAYACEIRTGNHPRRLCTPHRAKRRAALPGSTQTSLIRTHIASHDFRAPQKKTPGNSQILPAAHRNELTREISLPLQGHYFRLSSSVTDTRRSGDPRTAWNEVQISCPTRTDAHIRGKLA